MTDFEQKLREYLQELNDLRQRGASEDSIRDAFLRFLRAGFPRLERLDSILLEKHIPAVKVRGGFADALYADLIFELKKRLDDRSRTDGREELFRYLSNQKHADRFLGILTDGETMEVYALRNDELAKVDELVLVADRASDARLWLDCYLFHEKQLTPTAKDVSLRFGEHSLTFWHCHRVLQDLWQEVGSDPAVQTKFAEWQSLLSIVYGSAVGDEDLFLRHTYLALFARVMAFVALQREAPKSTELSGILSGNRFQQMGLENFVEDDFFTWVANQSVVKQANGLLHVMATNLTASYDLSAIHEDLLKELYQELVDPQTRHDLGEFYTPDWLAELALREAGFPAFHSEEPSLLDPSCGSGTFLFTAVRLLREAGWKGEKLVEFCTHHLAGLDVHPLAVTIAKTNLLLALGDDLRKARSLFGLPIYMADALLPGKPKMKAHGEWDVIPVSVDTESITARTGKRKPSNVSSQFELPIGLAEQPAVFHDSLNALFEFGDPKMDDKDAWEGFKTRLQELKASKNQWIRWHDNLRLMRWLLQPPVTDSIWRFVLRNAQQPELFTRRKFAFVAGNPPWLSYRYIKRRDYQQRVRKLIFDFELLGKRQSHLFTQMELATLFFVFCTDRYLGDDGTIAFVMPRSVLTGAKQHAAFREQYVAASTLLIDCEQVSPLFNVPTCVIITPKRSFDKSQVKKSIPMLNLRARLSSRNLTLTEIQNHWRRSKKKFNPLTTEETSPYWNKVTQGATLVPRSLWFVNPLATAKIIDRKRPQLETEPSVERRAKTPWKGIHLSGNVESEFLFATLLSEGMIPFGWRHLSLVILPLRTSKSGKPQLLTTETAIRKGKTGLADWLRKAEEFWLRFRKSKVDLVDYIDWQNKLTRQYPSGITKLLYNATGSYICSCVVDCNELGSLTVNGLPIKGFFAQHKNYWLETNNPNEAHYLCAILNAPLVDAAIKPYQPKGLGGERGIERLPFEVLPIPAFDGNDKHHQELAKLSEQCHTKVGELVADADDEWLKAPIGRLRTQIRKEVLSRELKQIDKIAARILKKK